MPWPRARRRERRDNARMSSSIADYVRSVESRLLGRVFTYDSTLHYVLETDQQTGLARLTCRCNGRTEVRFMPVAEVCLRVAGVLD